VCLRGHWMSSSGNRSDGYSMPVRVVVFVWSLDELIRGDLIL